MTAEPLCGKSVLSKSLIESFCAKNSTKATSTCYFFFDENSTENSNVKNALCAILQQLFAQDFSLIKHARSAFSENGLKLPGLFEPLWKSFADAISDPGVNMIYCVIDGLDECSPDGRALLLQEIARLFQYHETETNINNTEMCTNSTEISDYPKTPRLKLLITSRPDRSIEEGLQSVFPSIEAVRIKGEDESGATLIQQEIDHVIEEEINSLRELRERFGIADDATQEVFAKLKQVTNRTYLWISLVFEDLKSKADQRKQEMLAVLDSLPGQSYELMLLRSTDFDTTRKLLQILLAAEEPLTVTEMQIALNIRKEHRSINDLNLESEATFSGRISQLCGRILNIKDQRVHFIHSTAKDFLLAKENEPGPTDSRWKHSISHRDASLVIAKACITYLSFTVFETKPLTEINFSSASDAEFMDLITPKLSDYLSKHKFLEYAAKNCMKHVSQAGTVDDDCEIANLAYTISESSSKRFWTWIAVCKDGDPRYLREFHSGALSVGCHWGLSPLVEMWLQQNCDRDRPRNIGRSVATASRFGYCRCLELIFDHADDPGMRIMEVDAYGLDEVFGGDTSLHIAARHGHEDIVKMLLARHVPLEKLNEKGSTAFSDAMTFHALSTAQLLLEAGANPASFSPLLGVAVRHKEYPLANILLQYDAQPDGEDQATALSKLQMKSGKLEPVAVEYISGRFQSYKIDCLSIPPPPLPSVQSKTGPALLRWSPAERSVRQTIPPLHQRGAQPESETGPALLSWYSRDRIVRQTWHQRGAQPDRVDQATIGSKFQMKPGMSNRRAFSEFIMKHNQDFRKDDVFSTPMVEAAANGNDEMVTSLIKRGATVNPRETYITPLKRAIMDLQISTARILIESGADVHDDGALGKMPLHFAAEAGSLDLVKLLIDHKADIHARNHRDETPLHLAAGFGHGAVVEHLLNLKAAVDCVDKSGRTALSRAASTRTSGGNYSSHNIFPHAHTVQLLLRAGADPNLMDHRGRSPLTYSRLPNPRTCVLTGTGLEKLQIERAAIAKLLARHDADEALNPSAESLIADWRADCSDPPNALSNAFESPLANNSQESFSEAVEMAFEPPLANNSQESFSEAVEMALEFLGEDRSVAKIRRPQDAEINAESRLQLPSDLLDIFKPWDREGTFMAAE